MSDRKEKFTPGPWRRKRGIVRNCEWHHLFTAKRGSIVLFGADKNLSQEDANLIAAAPELYEALSDVMDEISSCLRDEEYYFGTTERFDKARATLAKARGEK